jgi:hypothetical protein
MLIIVAGIFISLVFFYYMGQKRNIRKEQTIENNKERYKRLLKSLKKPDREKNDEVSDTTEAQ